MTFNALTILPGATPCAQVNPADIDLADLEYSPIPTFSLPNTSAETKCTCKAGLEEQVAILKHALAPFAKAGQMYRQAGASLHWVVLSAESEEGEAILSVKDFAHAADVLK